MSLKPEEVRFDERGLIPADQVRRITVTDALVDTGSTLLALPSRLIRQLGKLRRLAR